MKKYFIIALSVVALAFTSCADFLNTSPQGSPTTDTFFQNDDQAMAFAKGLYERYTTESLYGRNIMWEQIAANDFVLGRTYPDRFSGALLTITGDEGSINDIYNNCYKHIANCQWGIQKLNAKLAANGSLSEIETRTLGEAYFFRALYHWAIASRHGLGDLGVPFKPWEEYEGGYNNEILPQQPSVVDNYLYIIADLKKAEELLPWKGSITATYDEAKCVDALVEIAVQINGKVRARINVAADIEADAAIALAKEKGIAVCDVYHKWKKLHAAGVDITKLLANRINHPVKQMHDLFVTSIIETLFFA